MLDFLRRGDPGARPERPTIQRRGCVGITECVLDLPQWIPQAGHGERAAEHVAGAGTVDAIHLESGRPNLAATTPGEAPVLAEGHGHQRGAKFPSERLNGAAMI